MAYIFHTPSYTHLAQKIVKAQPQFKLGKITRKDFPDGEHYLRIDTDVKNQDVIVMGGTISDKDTLEIYDLSCALVKYGAKSLILVIPYYGYSTMERAVKKGEVVGAKTRARLLSSIPSASEGNRIILMDLHSEGIPYYFEGDVAVRHVYVKNEVLAMAKKFGKKDFVLASTDAGRAKWVQSLALELGVLPAFVYKQRDSGSETHVTGINADVTGKHVVIYDDMIRTGGSLISAAEAYLSKGAKEISAICTHGVLPEGSLEKLLSCGLFKNIGMSDTHSRVEKFDLKDFKKRFPKTEVVISSVDKNLGNELTQLIGLKKGAKRAK